MVNWAYIIHSNRPDALELYHSVNPTAPLDPSMYYNCIISAGHVGNGELLERLARDWRAGKFGDVSNLFKAIFLSILLGSYRALPPERYLQLLQPSMEELVTAEHRVLLVNSIHKIQESGHTYLGQRLAELVVL